MLVSGGVRKSSHFELAEQLVEDLHEYYDKVGFYPEDLREFSKPRQLQDFRYSVFTDQQNFTIY